MILETLDAVRKFRDETICAQCRIEANLFLKAMTQPNVEIHILRFDDTCTHIRRAA